MLKVERVEKIIKRISLRKAEAMGNARFEEADLWADLLIILREYKKMKAGAAPPPKAERRFLAIVKAARTGTFYRPETGDIGFGFSNDGLIISAALKYRKALLEAEKGREK